MKSPIGIGFLSFAHAHVGLYAEVMSGFEDVNLVTAFDDGLPRGRNLCEQLGMVEAATVDAVLTNPDVDAVIIGCETSRHAEMTIAAANAGKHILLQKPMAMSLDECDRMIAAAEGNGVRLDMAFQMRCDPANIKIREIVQSGVLGPICMIRRRHSIPCLLDPNFSTGSSKWHTEADKNLGMFADDAAHPADWFHWIFGKPVSVMAEIDNIITDCAPDDNGAAIFRFAQGEMGILLNSSTTWAGENTTEIIGEKGTLIQNYGDGPSCTVPRCPDGPALKVYHKETGTWEVFDIPIPDSQADRLKAIPRPWVDALLKDTPFASTGYDGRVALEMILAAYESARTGRRITL